MDMYSNTISLEPVIYLIEEINKDISNKKISQQEEDELLYILKTEINTAIDSITTAGTEALLNIVFITL